MKRISILPRWVHKLYARWMRYFWLLFTTLCGRPLGGHETVAWIMENEYNKHLEEKKVEEVNKKETGKKKAK